MTSRSPDLHREQLRWEQRKCCRVAVHAGEMPLGCVIGSACGWVGDAGTALS